MKYFFILVSFVPVLFGYQVGKSSIGGQLGFSSSEFSLDYGVPGVSDYEGDLSGFSFQLTGNINVLSKKSFGMDLYSNFSASPSLNDTINGVDIETGVYNLNASIRPYFRSGIFSPYLILGISYNSFEIDEEGFSGWSKGTKFSPALGFGASLEFTESLIFSPSFIWTKVEVPSVNGSWAGDIDFGSTNALKFTFPLTYQVNENFSIGAEVSHTNFTEIDLEYNAGFLGIINPKVDYWITSLMFKSDFVF